MRTGDLAMMRTEELVSAYVSVSEKEGDATDRSDVTSMRTFYDQRMRLDRTLRARGVEARLALLPLLKHRNAEVRLNAATHLLAIAPKEARATLEDLAAHGPSQQRGAAGMCFWYIEKGIFKPT